MLLLLLLLLPPSLLAHVCLRALTAQQQALGCCQHIHMSVMWVHRQQLIQQLLIKRQRYCATAKQTHSSMHMQTIVHRKPSARAD